MMTGLRRVASKVVRRMPGCSRGRVGLPLSLVASVCWWWLVAPEDKWCPPSRERSVPPPPDDSGESGSQ